MTAEIAILNRSAIALAADSAVTVRSDFGHKIFDTANKLFSLSKYQPVGMLIYGNAQLMGVPWGLIIKEYRRQLGQESYDSLEGYCDSFVSFLSESRELFPEKVQKHFVHSVARSLYRHLSKRVDAAVRDRFDDREKVTITDVQNIISRMVDAEIEHAETNEFLHGADSQFEANVGRRYASEIRTAREEFFGDYPTTSGISRRLNTLVRRTICRRLSESYSGFVIAGYGEKDIFPDLYDFRMDGIVSDTPLIQRVPHTGISWEHEAVIIPFAQSDVVSLFMEGVAPQYAQLLDRLIRGVFQSLPDNLADFPGVDAETDEGRDALESLGEDLESLANELSQKAQDFRFRQHVAPVVEAVSILPKDELAAVAESLVNLTSFKRRFSMGQLETVGGAIDVAVISKGDGFVWINRKHYFPPELNHQFFANYFRSAD